MAGMTQMLDLLDAEFFALKEKEQDRTIQLTQDKANLLNHIASTEADLLARAQETGFDGQDLATHLARQCSQYNAEDIRSLAQQVQQANQRNGALLQALIRINEQGLNLLLGKNTTPNVYGATGQITSSPSQLTKLATA